MLTTLIAVSHFSIVSTFDITQNAPVGVLILNLVRSGLEYSVVDLGLVSEIVLLTTTLTSRRYLSLCISIFCLKCFRSVTPNARFLKTLCVATYTLIPSRPREAIKVGQQCVIRVRQFHLKDVIGLYTPCCE